MSEKAQQNAPERCSCCTCGYTWVKGQHGGHSCAQVMEVTVAELRARLAKYEDAEGNPISTIAEQAREIERLKADLGNAFDDDLKMSTMRDMELELAALKAQPSGVVLPERRPEVDGTWGDMGDAYSAGVNDTLDEVARLNSSPVSAGEPAKCNYQDDPRSPSELSLAGCKCVRFGEGNPHWPCKLHPAASAGGVDERAAFEAWYVTDCLETAQIVITQEGVSKLRGPHGDYRERAALHGKWVGWQARAALTASAPNHGEQVRTSCSVERPCIPCFSGNGRCEAPESEALRIVSVIRNLADCGQLPDLPDDLRDRIERLTSAPSAGSQGGDV